MTVLWGSQTGTAHLFADQLEEEIADRGIALPTEVLDPADYDPVRLKDEDVVCFILACYGMGEPTDNAKALYDWLTDPARKSGELAGVRYSVFGLGSSKTHKAYYQVVGRSVDTRMAELGATRFHPLGEGDDDASYVCACLSVRLAWV